MIHKFLVRCGGCSSYSERTVAHHREVAFRMPLDQQADDRARTGDVQLGKLAIDLTLITVPQ